MAGIELQRVTKRYPDGTEGVKTLDLDIGDGEFMILVGPSGCGKSTALRMVAGLEEITDGDLLIGGRRVNEVPPKDRDIAMVFQNYALYPHMTVRENMGYALKKRKIPRDQVNRKVEETAETLDLTEHLDRKPGTMSGGQRQRVAMGRAIVREPQAFLMDEPLSNLDAKLRVQMRGEVARLQKRLGTTTLYVTHDQTEAMTLGDRVAVMRGGHLQQVGPPKELYLDPVNLFVAGFIGSPAMNFMAARLEGDKLKLPFGDVPLEGRLRERLERNGDASKRDVIAGMRPEHFEDARYAHDVEHPLKFKAKIDVVEEMGSELYAFFQVHAGAVRSSDLEELDADTGAAALGRGDDEQVSVARLNAESDAKSGGEAELVLDTDKITLFAHDGENLMLEHR
ncbi:MAG: multiple sugar transport system ATP-binding protein [Solirubrobacteraceae bacterium]|jgi:multiple sugar transport system ATP-binding protein|nr:multiple sugar transport system ATP-binding protein [Solirubrobacteraceae bacterium]